jgi:membrane protease YdiL (CAAX protease family)
VTVPLQARVASRDLTGRRHAHPARLGRGRTAGAAAPAVLAGLAFLAARPGLEALPPAVRTGVLAAGYIALGLAAAATSPRVPRPLPPSGARAEASSLAGVRSGWGPAGAALAVGAAAIGAAALLAGPVPPLPGGVVALALSLLAAVAEEALFRGALYGALERHGTWLAVAVSALLFALVHVPSYGLAALPVDLGAGLLFGWQRWASGRWTVPAATHAAANLLAVILR